MWPALPTNHRFNITIAHDSTTTHSSPSLTTVKILLVLVYEYLQHQRPAVKSTPILLKGPRAGYYRCSQMKSGHRIRRPDPELPISIDLLLRRPVRRLHAANHPAVKLTTSVYITTLIQEHTGHLRLSRLKAWTPTRDGRPIMAVARHNIRLAPMHIGAM